jgi:hypothetical protein
MFLNKEGLKMVEIHNFYHLALSCLESVFDDEDTTFFLDIMTLNLARFERIIIYSGGTKFMIEYDEMKNYDYIFHDLFDNQNKILQAKLIIFCIINTLHDMDYSQEKILEFSAAFQDGLFQSFGYD